MRGQPIVYETLANMGIPVTGVEHEPVFTIEQMERIPFPDDVVVAKSLFLRDAKGKRHFLVVMPEDKAADIRSLAEKLGSTRLSFASEDRLLKYLGLTPGSVNPFGVLNDAQCAVEVVFDNGLAGCPRLGVHPNDNSATLYLTFSDVVRMVEAHGNVIHYV